MNLRCRLCGHTWSVDFKLPMEVNEFLTRLGEVYCENCTAPDTAEFESKQEFGRRAWAMPEGRA